VLLGDWPLAAVLVQVRNMEQLEVMMIQGSCCMAALQVLSATARVSPGAFQRLHT
jgi:hypothetical protein